jgi:hypothetical protein
MPVYRRTSCRSFRKSSRAKAALSRRPCRCTAPGRTMSPAATCPRRRRQPRGRPSTSPAATGRMVPLSRRRPTPHDCLHVRQQVQRVRRGLRRRARGFTQYGFGASVDDATSPLRSRSRTSATRRASWALTSCQILSCMSQQQGLRAPHRDWRERAGGHSVLRHERGGVRLNECTRHLEKGTWHLCRTALSSSRTRHC